MLAARGIARACVTNTQEGLAREILEAAGLISRFEAIVGVVEGRREKPAPDLLLLAAARIAVAPAARRDGGRLPLRRGGRRGGEGSVPSLRFPHGRLAPRRGPCARGRRSREGRREARAEGGARRARARAREVRSAGIPSLVERSRGIFYRRGVAVLHFHEDEAGLFADLKTRGAWRRTRVSTRASARRSPPPCAARRALRCPRSRAERRKR